MTNETRSSNLTHVVLTLVALTGLALFILACRPSWSPDGRKVVYSYWDEGAQKAAVVMFDRKARTSKVIFEMSSDGKSSKNILAPQWSKDGQSMLVALPRGGDELTIVSLPQDMRKTVQTFSVGNMDTSDEFAFLPFPEIKNQLFVTGDKARARVNLQTGEIVSFAEKEKSETLLYEAGEKILYLRQIGAEKKDEAKQGEVKKDSGEKKNEEEIAVAYEFGELDQKDLSLHPTLTLKIDELRAKGIGEPSGFLDVNPSNSKIAAAEDPLEGKQPRILLIGQSGIEQVLEVDIKEKPFKLGNPQWSRDGKTIYVTALIEDDKAKTYEFALVELAADGMGCRIDRIAEGPKDEMGNDYLSTTQIALSPDGKLIAASNGYTDAVKPEKIGLYLLDLSKTNRPVSFYPAPLLPKVRE